MALLRKLKSLLGLDEGRSSSDRSGDDSVGVTVEHDRSDDRTAPEPEPGSGSAAETDPEGPPIGSGPESEPIGQEPAGIDAEEPVDEETASNPEEAPPGTDTPGTETAEPAPAETGESADEGAGVDGTVDVEPDVDSPEPEGGVESEPDIGDSVGDEGGSSDEALQDLKGIGPSYETTLSEAGIETVDELADADADELSDETGLSSKRLQRWIDRARSR